MLHLLLPIGRNSGRITQVAAGKITPVAENNRFASYSFFNIKKINELMCTNGHEQ
jgi:hypothetical protein